MGIMPTSYFGKTNIMVQNNENGSKNKEVHPALYKTFLVMAMVSFTLGALVNFYTLRQLSKR